MLSKKWLKMCLLFCALAPVAIAQDLDEKADESWISISGWAISADEDSFVLDYGKNTVVVDVNNWGWYTDNFEVVDGNKVTVYGEVDDDLYETTTIDANSIYVEGIGTYFYANEVDKKTDFFNWLPAPGVKAGMTTLTGKVTSISGREFTISQGKKKMMIDTLEMDYNPMDDLGFQNVEKGDLVRVTGRLETGSFEEREIVAANIVNLEHTGQKN